MQWQKKGKKRWRGNVFTKSSEEEDEEKKSDIKQKKVKFTAL